MTVWTRLSALQFQVFLLIRRMRLSRFPWEPIESRQMRESSCRSILRAGLVAGALFLEGLSADVVEPQHRVAMIVRFAFEPAEGKLLAALDNSGQATLWHIADPVRSVRVCTIPASVADVSFIPTDRILLAAGRDGLLSSWTFACQPGSIPSRRISDAALTRVVFDAPGARILAGDANGSIHVLDLKGNRTREVKVPVQPVPLRANNPDGLSHVIGDRMGRPLSAAFGPGPVQLFSDLTSIQPLPDGRILAGTWDGRVTLCSLGIQDLCSPFAEHLHGAASDVLIFGSGALVSYSRPLNRLVTAGYDGTLRITSADGVPEGTVKLFGEGRCSPSPSPVTAMEFHPDGRTLLVASLDACITILDVEAQRPQFQRGSDPPEGRHLGVHPTGAFFVTDLNGGELWNFDYSPNTGRIKSNAVFPALVFREDGKQFVLADRDNIEIYTADGKPVCRSEVRTPRISSSIPQPGQAAYRNGSLAVLTHPFKLRLFGEDCAVRDEIDLPVRSPQVVRIAASDRMVFASMDKHVAAWSLTSRRWTAEIVLRDSIGALAWSEKEHRLLIGDQAGNLSAADESLNVKGTIRAHNQPIAHIAVSGRMAALATGTSGGEARFWVDSGKPASPPFRPDQQYTSTLSLDANGEQLILASPDGTTLVQRRGLVSRRLETGAMRQSVMFSAVERMFVEAYILGGFRIWTPPGPRRGAGLQGNEGAILSALPDRTVVVAGGSPGALRYWSPTAKALLGTVPLSFRVASILEAGGPLLVLGAPFRPGRRTREHIIGCIVPP